MRIAADAAADAAASAVIGNPMTIVSGRGSGLMTAACKRGLQ